ncbi:MAG TPA: hydrophobic protein [Actinomycetota bacterium]|nr:hydrophobic protein [Actinomycetota bacterium]
MGALLVLFLVLALFGGGFAVKALWYVAIIAFVLWLAGFYAAGNERRWYRW